MCVKAEGVWWWWGPLGGCQGQTLGGSRLRGCLAGGLSGGAPSTTVHQGNICYRTPCVRAWLHPAFLPELGPPSLQGKAPPCRTQGPGPPFTGSETDSTTDRGRKRQFAQADQATCFGGLGSKSAKICCAVDCTDGSAQADHSHGHQLLKSHQSCHQLPNFGYPVQNSQFCTQNHINLWV